MFRSKKISIRSYFFKIFVTGLPTKFFHYEPCGYQSLLFTKSQVLPFAGAKAKLLHRQKVRLGFSKQIATDLNKKNYEIIRPLLYLSRNHISLICKKLLIPVYPDSSNQCIKYSRNRIRKQLLPSLKLFYNPQIEQALFQFAEFVCKEQDFITVLLNAIPHNFLKMGKDYFLTDIKH